ncbi:MAG: hypothetical protein L6408_02325 [Nanoarchaeota archaeon]|nr:hypothetical protein [Nanoarchaeota archaeon]
MKFPKSFRTEKDLDKKVHELVNKSLVDKILVEKFVEQMGDKIKEYMDNERITGKIMLYFRKNLSIHDFQSHEMEKSIFTGGEKSIETIQLTDVTKKQLITDEKRKIIESLYDLDPILDKDDLLNDFGNSFEVMLNDFIYTTNFEINVYNKFNKKTDRVQDHTIEVVKKGKKKHWYSNRKNILENKVIQVPVYEKFYNPTIEGSVTYIKFDVDHNKNLIKALRNNDFSVKMEVL